MMLAEKNARDKETTRQLKTYKQNVDPSIILQFEKLNTVRFSKEMEKTVQTFQHDAIAKKNSRPGFMGYSNNTRRMTSARPIARVGLPQRDLMMVDLPRAAGWDSNNPPSGAYPSNSNYE
jgi:hypothetical protein